MLKKKIKSATLYLYGLPYAFIFSFLSLFLVQLILALVLVSNVSDSYAASFLPNYDISTGISGYITALYNYAISMVGILSAVVMMYGGIIWTTAGGNQGKVTEAQNWITAAATGLILALASYIILVNINPVLKDNKVPEFGISAPSAVNMSGGISNIPSDSATSPLFTEGQITQSISACQGHDAEFNNAASANAGVDPNFLRAIAVQESSCGKNTRSNSACGFMQIESGTCKSLGFNDCCSSSQQSINAAAKYVSQLRTTCCNGFAVDPSTGCDCSDPKYLAAAYNGGRGANTKSSNCAGAYTRWECTINQGNYVGTFKTYVPNVLNTLKLK